MRLVTTFRGFTLRIDADYDPAERGDRDCPPCDELLIMGAIRGGPGGKVPIAITRKQEAELADQLLAEMHARRDD